MTTTSTPSIPGRMLSLALWSLAGWTLMACLSARYQPLPERAALASADMASARPNNVVGDESTEQVESKQSVRRPYVFRARGIRWPQQSLHVPVTIAVEPLTVPAVDTDIAAQIERRGSSNR